MSERKESLSSREIQTKLAGDSKTIHVNNFLTVKLDEVQFPGGARGTFGYLYDEAPAVTIIALDKIKGERSVFLVPQERYPSQSWGWEVPAGGVKEGEEPLDAAKRELEEEAGITGDHWHQLPIRLIENVGRANSSSDFFIAAGITVVGSMVEVEEVIGEGRWFNMDEVEDLIDAGEINTTHTVSALDRANAFIRRNPDHPISQIVG